VPSKFFGVLAAARPVVFVGAPDGELAGVIDAGRCGVVVAQGDGAGLAAAITGLAADRGRCVAMGQAGLALLREGYARGAAHAAWLRLLREVAG
jgi:glycosyltransferase involved in cell wall biosynthesis